MYHDNDGLPDQTDEAGWRALCAPVVEALRERPRPMAEVRMILARAKPSARGTERTHSAQVDHCLFWLEARGEVQRFDEGGTRKWRLITTETPGARQLIDDIQATTGALAAAGAAAGKPQQQDQEDAMTRELDPNTISSTEAAKLLGCDPSNIGLLVRRGKLKSPGRAPGKGRALLIDRRSLDELIATRKKPATSNQPKSQIVISAKAEAARRAKRDASAPARSASGYTLEDRVRALALLVDDGDLTPADAWTKLSAKVLG